TSALRQKTWSERRSAWCHFQRWTCPYTNRSAFGCQDGESGSQHPDITRSRRLHARAAILERRPFMLLSIRVKNCLLAAASCAALPVQCEASAAGSSNPGACSPPALGAPCPRGGATTQGMREPEPGFELGNPVHLASGNKYQLEVDLPPNPSAPGLELVRHYNGLSIQGGTLGRNCSLSYDARLMRRSGEWLLRQGDGSLFRAPSITSHGVGHVWNWPNGRALH